VKPSYCHITAILYSDWSANPLPGRAYRVEYKVACGLGLVLPTDWPHALVRGGGVFPTSQTHPEVNSRDCFWPQCLQKDS
jgi:hypothetical protein